jgi:hypothetical protein
MPQSTARVIPSAAKVNHVVDPFSSLGPKYIRAPMQIEISSERDALLSS